MLIAHNTYRKLHCAPPLVLNNKLNQHAQEYAEKLIITYSVARSGTPGMGENVWMQSISRGLGTIHGNTSTTAWYTESVYYNFSNPSYSSSTERFTQIIWKNSQKLGAAIAYNRGRSLAIAVAQYVPPGNIKRISESGRIVFDDKDNDDLDIQYRFKPSVRTFTGDALYTRELIDELSHPFNRQISYNLHDFFKRASTFTAAQTQFQKEMLDAHNVYRKRHCVGALVLDNTLSRQAQDYANKLIAESKFEHSGTKGVGENLWTVWSTGKLSTVKGSTPTGSWYDEIKFFDFNKPDFSYATGHFTQVVWKNSKKLGVGIAYNKDYNTAVVVAQYTSAGNVIGAFPQNVLQSTC